MACASAAIKMFIAMLSHSYYISRSVNVCYNVNSTNWHKISTDYWKPNSKVFQLALQTESISFMLFFMPLLCTLKDATLSRSRHIWQHWLVCTVCALHARAVRAACVQVASKLEASASARAVERTYVREIPRSSRRSQSSWLVRNPASSSDERRRRLRPALSSEALHCERAMYYIATSQTVSCSCTSEARASSG